MSSSYAVTLYSIFITVFVYLLSLRLSRRFPSPFTTPVFFSTVVLIVLLASSHISYKAYLPAKGVMTYFLGPATVALAVPLYKNRAILARYFLPVVGGILSGSMLTVGTALALAKVFQLSHNIFASLAVKSVTVPVASEVAKIIGGNEVLVAGFVMITGMIGAMFGLKLLSLARVHDPVSRGLALGTISHGIGTGEAVKEGELQGAVSGMAMGMAAILTSFILPWLF
ncbi:MULTISPECIES: LrgB family protein [Heyndrickxia]|uniref:LrgB family protein n=1 Tax=Heyndrickxia TaxID=2837504 RepID=UPI002DB85C83|nr:LrgB family protein [Weizmannia sp. CD-2023]MEC2305461.1 LrgB family protein [Weizmannia sp. CD-2023]MEC2341556.1 LrgB family protein [Weizmannia sp. CD-2023]